jgi:apolipoprotein N-acyltransferase
MKEKKAINWSSWRLWFAALATSALTVISYAPHHIWPLAFVALVPLTLSLRSSGAKERFIFGWVAGTCTTLGGFYWIPALIVNFGNLPLSVGILAYVALALQQGLVFAFAFAATRWLERGLNVPVVWSLPLGYVAAEAAIPLIFPWRLGYTQYLNPPFIQSAELGGPYLVTAFVVLANGFVASLVMRNLADQPQRKSGWLPTSAEWSAIALVVANVFYGIVRIDQIDRREAEAPKVRIGLVEADIPIEEKWNSSLYHRNLFRHQDASRDLMKEDVDLIIWPESAFELSAFRHSTARHSTLEEARSQARFARTLPFSVQWLPRTDLALPETESAIETESPREPGRYVPQRGFEAPLLFGVTLERVLTEEQSRALPPRGDRPRRTLAYNSALLVNEEGRVEGRAHKVVRMPISEYVPLAQTLYDATGINLYNVIPSAGLFGAGDGPQFVTLDQPDDDLHIGTLNCYEDLMPNFVRDMVRMPEGPPDVLVNLTNDAWFGRTAEPIQHFALSTFRSIEARTWLVRATNTGVSAFVDSAGRIIGKTGIYDAETLVADVPQLPAQKTLFVRLGHWPAYLSWVLVFFGLLRFMRGTTELGQDMENREGTS